MSEQKLAELGLILPAVRTPIANFLPFRMHNGVVYLAGQGPRKPDGTYHTGKVGRDVTTDEAYQHARLVALSMLSVAKLAAGSLDRIEFLKVLGLVNAAPDFTEHPKVINGCSDLLVEVLGDRGRHARSAMGMGSLPNNMTVEIEAVLRIIE
jgi:enamine deaminase RidA (YjgF/YER057c/UK114 family)